jgi:Holliday junction resolvase-like predicted endonuclease
MIDLAMTADERAAMMELKKLRNQVAHSTEATAITVEDALRFEDAANSLAKRMQALAEAKMAANKPS